MSSIAAADGMAYSPALSGAFALQPHAEFKQSALTAPLPASSKLLRRLSCARCAPGQDRESAVPAPRRRAEGETIPGGMCAHSSAPAATDASALM